MLWQALLFFLIAAGILSFIAVVIAIATVTVILLPGLGDE